MNRTFCLTWLFIVAVVALAAEPVIAGRLTIETNHSGMSGWPVELSITADSLGFQPGRFDLLVAVDPQADAVISVDPGDMPRTCGWEYFNYRVLSETTGTYDPGGNTQLLSITGVASSTGDVSPCYGPDDPMELARLRLWVSHRLEYECNFLPIRFFWRDCYDNTLTGMYGDSSHVAASLIDLDGDTVRTAGFAFPGFGIPDDTCSGQPGVSTVKDLACRNGGIDLLCADRYAIGSGDVNLNGLRFEPGDAITFANYFVSGIGAFFISPTIQSAATDVNGDGKALTFADLVFLVQVITADTFPNPKVAPGASTATVAVCPTPAGTVVEVNSRREIGAAYLRLVAADGGEIVTQGLTDHLMLGHIGDTATVLLIDLNGLDALPAGRQELVRTNRSDIRIVQAELYDSEGNRIAAELPATLPAQFELYQNYPNPFNPQTTISFRLPQQTDWTLTIFNALGQKVRSFSGNNGAGRVELVWNGENSAGSPVSSGVYYYRLEARTFSRTLPMVLLK